MAAACCRISAGQIVFKNRPGFVVDRDDFFRAVICWRKFKEGEFREEIVSGGLDGFKWNEIFFSKDFTTCGVDSCSERRVVFIEMVDTCKGFLVLRIVSNLVFPIDR